MDEGGAPQAPRPPLLLTRVAIAGRAPRRAAPQIERWYTRKARVASHVQTSANSASIPTRVRT